MFHRTQNLFLRPAFQEDWKAVFAGIGEREIVRNLATAPWPYTEMDAKRWTALPMSDWLPSFVVVLPGDGVIGACGLGLDDATGEVQLGYWIARSHWGRGYASEAARGVLDVARAIGHRRIVASHFVDNPASGRVLYKAGFQPTGEIRPGYSLARGGHDPVACFEIILTVSENDGGDDGEASVMRQAA
ncbi:GNAT family N-acetyltransferase [Erythrobacter sp. W53]|uniref:GNAT family N-acetyltransferase n=1 Tax=Erythrobacter sp. W53 TaxID=3425947 RepID=UPI003D766EEF